MKWSTDDFSYVMSFCAKVFLFFAIISFAACLLGPLFGGTFILRGGLIYGSWVGFGLCWLFEVRRIKAGRINDTKFILVNIFEVFCLILSSLLMFPFPYNVLGVAFFLFIKLTWYKRFKRQINAEKIK